MSWEAVGALSELAGAIGVIASLIYVGMQVRQNTRSMRAATYDSLVRSNGEWLGPVIQDAALAANFEVAVASWSDVEEFLNTGAFFTVGVEVLLSTKIQQLASAIPIERLLTETDNPGGWQWMEGDRLSGQVARNMSQLLSLGGLTGPTRGIPIRRTP